MGVYDIIAIACPKCKEPYYAQSKSGACELDEYQLETAPPDVLADVNRHAPFECDCGAVFEVENKVAVECPMRERTDHLGLSNL